MSVFTGAVQVPQDLFEKMAALALAAIILLGVLSIQAFAADIGDDISYQDSGIVLGDIPSDPFADLAENLSAVRQDLDILLYFVIPCSVAVLFVYLLCKWFCSTFVDSVL